MKRTPERPAADPGQSPTDAEPVREVHEVRAQSADADYGVATGSPRNYGVLAILDLVIGLIFLALGRNFLRWFFTTITGGTFETGLEWGAPVNPGDPAQGTPIGYWELRGGTAWSDMGFAVFGLALIACGVVALLAMRRLSGEGLLKLGLALIAAATAVNLFVSLYLFTVGIMPLLQLIVVAIGGVMVVSGWPRKPRRSRGNERI